MFVDYVNLQIQYMSYMSCFSILKYTSPIILTSCEKEGPMYSFQAQKIFISGFYNPILNGTMRMRQTAHE